MVSRHDPFITDEDRDRCRELASEIDSLARDLVEAIGVEKPENADPGEFYQEYEDGAVHIVWKGPKNFPSDSHWKVLVFAKMMFVPKGRGGWPPVIWMFDSSSATLECDTALAQRIVEHLRLVAALPCYCCGKKRPPYWRPE